ncbi:hypothetical protein NIES4101_53340 [Calothrix sp. NIES-4101]|nr:hypothetical protein NIES4101_53340 [Calothrix sp. NIES-4101]
MKDYLSFYASYPCLEAQSILDVLRVARRGLVLEEICDRVEQGQRTARNILEKLIEEGKVSKSGEFYYFAEGD